MTPKEKAVDIWSKLFHKQIDVTGDGDGNLCVELSLILVDEVLTIVHTVKQEQYWEQVKHEIEKL